MLPRFHPSHFGTKNIVQAVPRCQVLVSSIQLLVIIAFLANLSEVDEWKWLISFAVPCLDGEKKGETQ